MGDTLVTGGKEAGDRTHTKKVLKMGSVIKHPFHPHHLLARQEYRYDIPISCSACGVVDDRSGFRCETEDCYFEFHVDCASLLPTIKCEAHPHLLSLFNSISHYSSYFDCNTCGEPCVPFVLRCVACNFNLHTDCHPSLPLTIEHECHPHPLTLTNSVLDQGVSFSEDHYCNACEQKRDPKYPVYYCEECLFPAHVTCVISQVLPSLIAEKESDAGASEKVGVGIAEDPTLIKLDEEIKKLRIKVGELKTKYEAMSTKLESLESERAQYVASTMPSLRN